MPHGNRYDDNKKHFDTEGRASVKEAYKQLPELTIHPFGKLTRIPYLVDDVIVKDGRIDYFVETEMKLDWDTDSKAEFGKKGDPNGWPDGRMLYRKVKYLMTPYEVLYLVWNKHKTNFFTFPSRLLLDTPFSSAPARHGGNLTDWFWVIDKEHLIFAEGRTPHEVMQEIRALDEAECPLYVKDRPAWLQSQGWPLYGAQGYRYKGADKWDCDEWRALYEAEISAMRQKGILTA